MMSFFSHSVKQLPSECSDLSVSDNRVCVCVCVGDGNVFKRSVWGIWVHRVDLHASFTDQSPQMQILHFSVAHRYFDINSSAEIYKMLRRNELSQRVRSTWDVYFFSYDGDFSFDFCCFFLCWANDIFDPLALNLSLMQTFLDFHYLVCVCWSW